MKTYIRYFYRGEVERGTGDGYNWHPGYSETSEDGSVLFPWMTIAECRAQAKAQGATPQFLCSVDQKFPQPKLTEQQHNAFPKGRW